MVPTTEPFWLFPSPNLQHAAADRRAAGIGVRAGEDQGSALTFRQTAAAADRTRVGLADRIGEGQGRIVEDVAGDGPLLVVPSPSCR